MVGARDFAAGAFAVDVAETDVESGFGEVDALESPGDFDELVEEEGFGGALGVVFEVEGVVEGFVVFALFAHEDGGFCGEGVFEGVECGDGFAVVGAGAGALEGVGAVGEEATAAGEGGESVGAGVEEVFGVGVEGAVGVDEAVGFELPEGGFEGGGVESGEVGEAVEVDVGVDPEVGPG